MGIVEQQIKKPDRITRLFSLLAGPWVSKELQPHLKSAKIGLFRLLELDACPQVFDLGSHDQKDKGGFDGNHLDEAKGVVDCSPKRGGKVSFRKVNYKPEKQRSQLEVSKECQHRQGCEAVSRVADHIFFQFLLNSLNTQAPTF